MSIFFKFSTTSILLFLSTILINGQTVFGHEWIDVPKKYYKLKIAQKGIYKVTFEELSAAGFPSGPIDGRALKLINFGKEQPIFVSDTDFGPGDYIEFYGEKNTIGLDSLLYSDWKKDLFNPEYSLVNDTNAYFLTISPESSNLRYTLISPDYGNTTLPPFPFYLHTEKVVYSGTYFKNIDADIRYSHFEPSEGFGSGVLQSSNTPISTSMYYDAGPKPALSLRSGQNNHLAKLEISWNSKVLETRFINPKTTSQFAFELEKGDIKNANTLSLKNTNSDNDRHTIAYASLTYPRIPDFGNAKEYEFTLTPSSGQRLLQINAFNTGNQPVYVYDVKRKIRYNTSVPESNKVVVITNPVDDNTAYYIASVQGGYKSVDNISLFQPRTFENNAQDYIIISNNILRSGPRDYVREYADYRRSPSGGSYQTEIVDIQDIYDHFAYGIDRHFIGIKQFAGLIKQEWTSAKFVLLMGKGIEYPFMRTTNDVINNDSRVFFIPTFGFVGSDNMLFSEGNFPDPYFAIGRIAVRTGEEIKNYLEKVKQYEQAPYSAQTIEEKYWMKRVLHLGGGGTVFEQTAIRNGLLNMENILEQSMMGAEVSTYYKTSTDILQSAKIDEIKKLINSGINMLTFFGHSAPGTWDFNVEDPSKFENFKKYPLINSLGCFSGNIHSTSQGLSERFVLTKDKGSIAFLASAGAGFINQLSNYGYNFYRKIGDSRYGKPLGLVLNEILHENRHLLYAEYAFNQQQTFHGDPAIALYHFDGPDYVFDTNSFAVEPKVPNSSTESISISFDIVNLGKYNPEDTLNIRFLHQIPGGKIADTMFIRIPGPAIRSKHSVVLKGQGISGLGKNILFGTIDPDDKNQESPWPSAKENNMIGQDGFAFYIYDNSAIPIYPREFGIVGNMNDLVLKASTFNAALDMSNYFIEVDTSEYYNSPILYRATISSLGGVITHKPTIQKLPNTVYYWRIIPDSTQDFRSTWQGASFIYLPGEKEGWNQSHFFQFKKDEFKKMMLDENSRKFFFGNIENSVRLRNKLYEESDRPGYFFNFVLFRSIFTAWEFMDSGVGVVVNSKNDNDFFPLLNPPGGLFGSVNNSSITLRIFPFKTDNIENRKKLMDFIENQIKDNYYINLFTIIPTQAADLNIGEWASDSITLGKNLFSVLEKFGAQKIRELNTYGSVPYILQAHKGEEGLIGEEIATSKNGIVDLNSILRQKGSNGIIASTKIGPSSHWDKIDIRYNELNPTEDTAYVKIYGIDTQNQMDLLYDNITKSTDLNIDAQKYRYLKLETYQSDVVSKSAAQLDFWRVFYTPLPEAALSATIAYAFHKDTLQEGESMTMKIGVENINKLRMDSLLVHYTVTNDQNEEVRFQKRIAPLAATQKGEITFSYPTKGKVGNNQLVVEMNPENDQPEAWHANNYFIKSFYVEKDRKNPLLDVFFDGIKIMDGDIVSPKPEIKITLNDDNIYLPLNDPSLFSIQLDTGRNNTIEIPYNDPRIKFIPPSPSNHTAALLYYPELKTGDYKLVVQAKDASGNNSGINPRSVNFKVIEHQSVSNVLNYPNPFSTSTQFIFTLTGESVPDIMSISIMTLTGKVVREITKEQLGPLHIGINRTEYKWDGTDEYGSKLANGVYLYKVNVRKTNGEKYDQYNNTKADAFFKEGFGKMVIMR